MPLSRIIAALVGLVFVAEHLFANNRADGTNLRVVDTKLASIIEDWVDVKC